MAWTSFRANSLPNAIVNLVQQISFQRRLQHLAVNPLLVLLCHCRAASRVPASCWFVEKLIDVEILRKLLTVQRVAAPNYAVYYSGAAARITAVSIAAKYHHRLKTKKRSDG